MVLSFTPRLKRHYGAHGDALRDYANALVWPEVSDADDEVRGMLQAICRQLPKHNSPNRGQLTLVQALAELNVANFSIRARTAVLTEGVIDAAVLHDGKWVVVDWKLNRSSDAVWQQQLATYERQAASYVETLQVRTGTQGATRIERLTGLD